MAGKKTVLLFIGVVLILLSGGYFQDIGADEIILVNGDRLTGTVTAGDRESITLDTEYSDPVKINRAKIRMITTDGPKEVHLTGGEVLKGRISTEGEGQILIEETADRGKTAVQLKRIAAINPPPVPPSRWKGSVHLGAGLQSGNTDRVNASFGADAKRRTEQDRFGLRFLFHYAEEDDAVSARSTFGALQYDYFFTKVLYGYLGVELLNDKFKDLNLRTIVGPGLGYQIWDDPLKSLAVEAGVSYFSEDLKEGEDDSWISARLAADLMYTIGNAVVFTDKLVIYPSLENFGEYQLRNEAALATPLGSGWSFRFANILDRDSHPPDGVKKHDLHWILGVTYDY